MTFDPAQEEEPVIHDESALFVKRKWKATLYVRYEEFVDEIAIKAVKKRLLMDMLGDIQVQLQELEQRDLVLSCWLDIR